MLRARCVLMPHYATIHQVWVVLALEFIAKQLTDGSWKCTDVLSLIVMREGAEIVIDRKPMDWTLFNSVIDLLHSSRPMEHGNYLPALQLAEELLTSNSHGSCALMLCFLSDGQPSDKVGRSTIFGETLQGKKLNLAVQRIEALASRFGRRLTIATIGFSGTHENFQVIVYVILYSCFMHPANIATMALKHIYIVCIRHVRYGDCLF